MIRSIVGIGILSFIFLYIRAESAIAGCTRTSLEAAAESYVAAQQAGDVSKMSLLSPLILITQNMKEVTKEQAFVNKAMPVTFHRNFLDVDTCQTYSEVIVTQRENSCVLGVRLKVDGGKIAEIDVLITNKGDWLFDAPGYYGYSKMEDWSPLLKEKRPTRKALIDAANAYLDIFYDKDSKVPWGIPCARLEGGAYTNIKNDPKATCNVGIPERKIMLGSRTYVIDTEMGTISVFCRFGNVNGPPDSHLIRLVDGKLRYVHTLTVMAQAAKKPVPKTPAKPATEPDIAAP
jgi:hypothetical protein